MILGVCFAFLLPLAERCDAGFGWSVRRRLHPPRRNLTLRSCFCRAELCDARLRCLCAAASPRRGASRTTWPAHVTDDVTPHVTLVTAV